MGFLDLSGVADAPKEVKHKQYSCAQCQLYASCPSGGKFGVQGEGKLGIFLILGDVSQAQENSNNTRQGTYYLYLKKRLKGIGIDIVKDCYTVNAIRCYKADGKYGAKAMNGCATLLQADLKRLDPKVIVPTDELAWNVLLSNRMEGTRGKGSLWDYAGSIIPDQELKRWVVPLTPTHFLTEMEAELDRKRKEYGERYVGVNRFEPHYTNQINNIIEALTREFPTYEYKSKVKIATNVEQAIGFLCKANEFSKFAFDYETTGLSWHNPAQKIHSVSFSDGNVSYAMLWYPHNEKFMHMIRTILGNDSTKIAQNKGFERSWSIGRAGIEPKNLVHDPMLLAHVYRNLAPTNLKFCLYREFGILGYDESAEPYLKASKEDEKKYGKNALNTIFDAPTNDVLLYVGLDSLFTYWLAKYYLEKMDKKHMLPGYRLLARAERPLTHMHLTGMRVDMEKLNYWKPILQERIDTQYNIIMNSDFIQRVWKSGSKFKPGNDADVRHLVYTILKFKPTSFTDSGLPSVDADALEDLRESFPIAEPLLEYRRWYKLLNTFIAQLEREQWDGVIHSYFSLNNVDSFRSGSQRVNLTNQPKHDKEVMLIIRSLFLPRKGHKLSSCDYAQLEVRANAGISGDRNLIASVNGSLDMHYALATKLFMLSEDQKNKKTRNVAKTNVFRLFYGGSGEQMGEGTWKIMNSHTAHEQFGMDMLAHIKSKGITTRDEWIEHSKNTEKWLWGDLFPEYQKWRKDTYADYVKTGILYYPNGFTYQGICSRNSVLNGPGQGAGFHVNLNAICNLFDEMEERGMDTKLIVEIHDDVMGDVLPEEEELYKQLLYKHCVGMKDEYSPWLAGVPLEVEYGCAEVDAPWSEIKEVGVLTGL